MESASDAPRPYSAATSRLAAQAVALKHRRRVFSDSVPRIDVHEVDANTDEVSAAAAVEAMAQFTALLGSREV